MSVAQAPKRLDPRVPIKQLNTIFSWTLAAWLNAHVFEISHLQQRFSSLNVKSPGSYNPQMTVVDGS